MTTATPKVFAGDLRHRIILRELEETDDGQGGVTTAKNDLATVWSRITPRIKQEIFETEQVTGRITHDIEIRHRTTDINNANLIGFGTREFKILAFINPRERNVLIKFFCQELPA